VLSVIAVPMLVLLIPIFDTTLVTISRMCRAGRRRWAAAITRRTAWSRSACRNARRSTLLWLLAAASGAIGVAFRHVSGVVVDRRGALRRRHDDVRDLSRRDPRLRDVGRAALERGGLTPIVVDFVYRRRVAEVLLDFVLVTVSYYAAYRLKFDFIEFAANFTYFTQSLPIVVAGAAARILRGWRLSGRVATFQRVGCGHVVRGALTSTILSALIFAYMFRDDPATPQSRITRARCSSFTPSWSC
jgi:UDP-GlcNAc:undecaprenyl-phosphate GlcNAc-1-phosphate transferase